MWRHELRLTASCAIRFAAVGGSLAGTACSDGTSTDLASSPEPFAREEFHVSGKMHEK
jgi:hypothetical protein